MTTRVILLIALAIFGFANVGRADIDKSSYFVVSYSRPKPLDSAKESLIKEGMTLKQVVADLGPGWMSPNEGVGFIQWFSMMARPYSYPRDGAKMKWSLTTARTDYSYEMGTAPELNLN